jgi:cytochrome oxidase assembly protein ShyY1
MGRLLLRPRWLAGLGLAVLVAVAFARLGVWQLDRMEQRRSFEDLVARRLAAAPAPLEEVLGTGADAESIRYRRVTAEGTFDAANEVILYGRTLGERTGNHVLTPLILEDGTAVAVDRGWVPLEDDEPPLRDAAPPAGTVRVAGVLFPSEVDPEAAASGEGADVRTTFAKVDLGAVSDSLPYPLAPAYLLLGSQDPRPGPLPIVAPLPDAGGGPPHLSYAIQWFTFAAIDVVGFVVLIRREARRSSDREDT